MGSEEGSNPEFTVKGEMRHGVGRGFGIYLIRPSEISEEKRRNEIGPKRSLTGRVHESS